MDADTISLVLTALMAAGAAGAVSGVQDVAGDAVKDSYSALKKRVSGLIGRKLESQEEADQLISNFQAEPERWRRQLAEHLESSLPIDDELAELRAEAAKVIESSRSFVLYDECVGVLHAPNSYGATQTNNIGVPQK